MKLKLLLLTLLGSTYGISKIEKCVIDKCSFMDLECANDCLIDNATPEQLKDFIRCMNKCPLLTGIDPCSLKCVMSLFNLPEQQIADKPTDDRTKTNGFTATGSADEGSKTNGKTDGGIKTNGTNTATSTDSGAKTKESTTSANKSNDATAILAKTTTFTCVVLFGMTYFL